ncbi:MAG: hypothetical protein V1772_05165 [Chloroflexota bacterium]
MGGTPACRLLATEVTSINEIELRDGRAHLMRLNDHAHLESIACMA